MTCGARNLLNYENSIKLPSIEDLENGDTGFSDVELNLKLLNKYFEVDTLDETLLRRRNEFKTRSEHLQKRKEALHDREIMLKERILSYEMYIKELAMKRDRSFRRIDDEKMFIKNKQIEIDLLKNEIKQMQEERDKIQKILVQYQPHLHLLTQIVDQTDRFQSIDEMIEKFDMLFASYEDILTTIKYSNEELNDIQRQLLLTVEMKTNKLSSMNNRIHELEQNLLEIQHRNDKIQTDIANYRRISIERLTESGAIKIAIESMFDLVQKYSHRSRRKDLNHEEYSSMNNQCFFNKLKQIDVFLSDLTYIADHVNTKQNKTILNEHSNNNDSIQLGQENPLHGTTVGGNEENNQWRGPCEMDRKQILIESKETISKYGSVKPYLSYKVRGEDNILYTIQLTRLNKPNTSRSRQSLSPIRSSISMKSRSKQSNNKEKKISTFRTSIAKLPQSINAPTRSPTIRRIRATFDSTNQQYNNERIPFSKVELLHRASIMNKDK